MICLFSIISNSNFSLTFLLCLLLFLITICYSYLAENKMNKDTSSKEMYVVTIIVATYSYTNCLSIAGIFRGYKCLQFSLIKHVPRTFIPTNAAKRLLYSAKIFLGSFHESPNIPTIW